MLHLQHPLLINSIVLSLVFEYFNFQATMASFDDYTKLQKQNEELVAKNRILQEKLQTATMPSKLSAFF